MWIAVWYRNPEYAARFPLWQARQAWEAYRALPPGRHWAIVR